MPSGLRQQHIGFVFVLCCIGRTRSMLPGNRIVTRFASTERTLGGRPPPVYPARASLPSTSLRTFWGTSKGVPQETQIPARFLVNPHSNARTPTFGCEVVTMRLSADASGDLSGRRPSRRPPSFKRAKQGKDLGRSSSQFQAGKETLFFEQKNF